MHRLHLAALLVVSVASVTRAADWWSAAPARNDPAAALRAVLGEKADAWKIASGEFTVAPDAALGANVLTVGAKAPLVLDGQTRYGASPMEIRARVRLRSGDAPAANAYFYLAQTEKPETSTYVNLSGTKGRDSVSVQLMRAGKYITELDKPEADKLDWPSANSAYMVYLLRAYQQIMPGWDETYRTRIEEAMSRLPGLQDKWIDVRIEFGKGLVRAWVDDRLVGMRENAALDPQGTLKIVLTPGVQLASYTISAPDEIKDFAPIPLGGYANARAFLHGASVDPKSLPAACEPVVVDGVPFVFPGVNLEGNDHLDIGESIFREGNAFGYFPSGPSPGQRWYGAAQRDPGRIQVRIPNDCFENLYLIAASDGDENSIPLVSAMFYRQGAGFAQTFEARVPLATADSSEAKPLPVKLSDGSKTNLWLVKIPLDRERLASFSDMDTIEIEFTKKVHQYRSYPDPISYGYHQGGLPSGVHIFAATLGRSQIEFEWKPDRFGHVWTAPEVPAYTATVTNHSAADITGKITVTSRSYDGTEETKQEQPITIPAGKSTTAKFSFAVKLNGYHDLVATLDVVGKSWTEKRSFVRLAPDTRSAKWTEGKGAMFGFWSYLGGHYTPKADHIIRLMTLAGARQVPHLQGFAALAPETQALILKHFARGQSTAYYVNPQPWAAEPNYDPAKVNELHDALTKAAASWEKDIPQTLLPENVSFFAEPHISARLTAGNFPEYWNGEPFKYTDEEQQRVKMYSETSRLAAQMVRKDLPGRKVMIPWGDPGFVVPILRGGFPKELVDGSSLDVPNFERLPEMQLYDNAIHRLYELRAEYKKFGIDNPQLWFCEGVFVPTEPGACTYREQMDINNRWALISMAYGVQRFYSGWFAFDCGNYYGAEHYGGCGIQRRIPYCDPKPAYAAYATMTDKLNEANFDGWVKTGSLTTYCLRFKHVTRGNIYALWSVRGKRPVTLTLKADGKPTVTDAMNNGKDLTSANKQITVATDPSVLYVTGAGVEIVSAEVGVQDNSDAKPDTSAKQIADLGDGSWSYTSERNEIYENNHWGFYPAAGKFTASTTDDPQQGKVLVSKLEKQPTERQLMPWYNILKPAKPIELPFAPSHLGLWVKGASDWGRMIYVLRDAKGERWMSIGTKDDYNCNDVHSWSAFNFDGWRYLRFELPGHTGWDSFRKLGTTWWKSDGGDTIVDLPLSLESIMVEQRTHVLYVNDVQPVASDTVALGKLFVEYDTEGDATADAVKISQLRMPLPKAPANLPNPIADLERDGIAPPTKLVKLAAPEHYYDGTRMHVFFDEVPAAKATHLWVSPHEDGRGAVNLVPAGIKNGQLVLGLRPGIKLYYWITYTDAQGKESKPSAVHEEITVDNFKEK